MAGGDDDPEERQTIVRLLVERILVEIIDGSEQVRIECHWQGGVRTEHRVIRPVANAKGLSTYDALVARASELRRAGHDCVEIAEILNREGWRPAKRCDAFSGSMVRHLLYAADPEATARRLRVPKIDRAPDEWTIPELSVKLGVPEATLYGWVRKGRLRSRSIARLPAPGGWSMPMPRPLPPSKPAMNHRYDTRCASTSKIPPSMILRVSMSRPSLWSNAGGSLEPALSDHHGSLTGSNGSRPRPYRSR